MDSKAEASGMNVGLVLDETSQLADLQNIIRAAGHTVAVSIRPDDENLTNLPEVDAWYVCLDMQEEKEFPCLDLLSALHVPVIYEDSKNDAALTKDDKIKRLNSKIRLRATNTVPVAERKRAEDIWVLAASTGGPEAVTAFLSEIPKNEDKIAFLYVQHIDQAALSSLTTAVLRNTEWRVVVTDEECPLYEKSIYIISPGHQVDMEAKGVLQPVDQAWAGPYAPSADQVIAKVARAFRDKAGVIIFSGMGDDGSKSCRLLRHLGGKVWAQSPESCTIDSMPVCAIATGMVSFKGTPKELATQFRYRRNN